MLPINVKSCTENIFRPTRIQPKRESAHFAPFCAFPPSFTAPRTEIELPNTVLPKILWTPPMENVFVLCEPIRTRLYTDNAEPMRVYDFTDRYSPIFTKEFTLSVE
jgi:hypothetical protein